MGRKLRGKQRGPTDYYGYIYPHGRWFYMERSHKQMALCSGGIAWQYRL
jgi:hypothetical protein